MHWSNSRQRWVVWVQKRGRRVFVGRYHDIDDAVTARRRFLATWTWN